MSTKGLFHSQMFDLGKPNHLRTSTAGVTVWHFSSLNLLSSLYCSELCSVCLVLYHCTLLAVYTWIYKTFCYTPLPANNQ